MRAKVWCEYCSKARAKVADGDDVDAIAEEHAAEHDDGEPPEETLVYVQTEDDAVHYVLVEPIVNIEWNACEVTEGYAANWIKKWR